jgi:hypothetical protein
MGDAPGVRGGDEFGGVSTAEQGRRAAPEVDREAKAEEQRRRKAVPPIPIDETRGRRLGARDWLHQGFGPFRFIFDSLKQFVPVFGTRFLARIPTETKCKTKINLLYY